MFGLLLNNVYTKFKLHFYQEMFAKLQSRETTLTTIETYCIEIIDALDHPTINEFANFIRISPPNAAYKINSKIRKGYLTKIRSENAERLAKAVSDKASNAAKVAREKGAEALDKAKEKGAEALDKAKIRLRANVNFDLVIELLLLTIKEN